MDLAGIAWSLGHLISWEKTIRYPAFIALSSRRTLHTVHYIAHRTFHVARSEDIWRLCAELAGLFDTLQHLATADQTPNTLQNW